MDYNILFVSLGGLASITFIFFVSLFKSLINKIAENKLELSNIKKPIEDISEALDNLTGEIKTHHQKLEQKAQNILESDFMKNKTGITEDMLNKNIKTPLENLKITIEEKLSGIEKDYNENNQSFTEKDYKDILKDIDKKHTELAQLFRDVIESIQKQQTDLINDLKNNVSSDNENSKNNYHQLID